MFKININSYFHNYLLDVTDTKIYKSKQIRPKNAYKRICTVKFDNKAIETIQLTKTLNHPEIIKTLPYSLQEKESIPTVTHKLANTIRNNTLRWLVELKLVQPEQRKT